MVFHLSMVTNHLKKQKTWIEIQIRIFTKINSFHPCHTPNLPPIFIRIRPQLFEISCTQTNSDISIRRQKRGENIMYLPWAQYVLVDQAFGGGGMRSTERLSRLFLYTIQDCTKFLICSQILGPISLKFTAPYYFHMQKINVTIKV